MNEKTPSATPSHDSPSPPPTAAPPQAPTSADPAGAPPDNSFWTELVDSVRRPVRRLLGVREKPLVRITEKPTPPKRKIRVLFVDVGNASRSQVAQAFATLYGFHAESAGTFPSLHVAPEAVATMRDIGVDISGFRPKPLDTSRLEAFDRIITFGQALPQQAGRNIQDWNVIDPRGLGIAGHERMREDIERRVKALARQLRVKQPALVALNP